MSRVPRLTIGLPVYNGERYLAEAIEALLSQSFGDFELIISDNASTDDTAEICRRYQKEDSRIVYVRQQKNIGMVPNHNFVVLQASGSLFKWAAYDDLYAPDILKRCVAGLDKNPDAVLAQSWCVHIDETGAPTKFRRFPAETKSPHVAERFRSLLFDDKGDYTYSVIRAEALRRTPLHGSYHRAEFTLVTELALHGWFYQIEDWLFFRRERPDEPSLSARERCANFDPRRGGRVRNPAIRLYAEYIWGYFSAIQRAPLSRADKRDCYLWLARWLSSRSVPVRDPLGDPVSAAKQPILYATRRLASFALPGRDVRVGEQPAERPDMTIAELLAGRGERP
jgi:glycosyltransferase involved in cell wall biosynthesis